MKGIDLSTFQRGVKISRKTGVDFIILRAGFTGYGAGRTKNKDAMFESFYNACKSANIPVGAYWYSCANTRASGIAEAQYIYENCLKNKSFEFPIYIDIEETIWQIGQKKGVTDAILGFCEYLEKKGFVAGVYSSPSWFRNQIDTKRLDKITKWVANWRATKPDFEFSHFDVWQNSDNGRIDGVRVDTDIAYRDFPTEIKAAGKNGFKAENKPKKTNEEIAEEVCRGLWDNGDERKKKLKAAGYDYDAIQKIVTQMMSEKKDTVYVVKKGDTLTAIAKKYNTTINKLKADNGIKNANLIYVGQKIVIKGK